MSFLTQYFSHSETNFQSLKTGQVKWDQDPRNLGTLEPGTRDLAPGFKVGPGIPRKFKSGTLGPPLKV